MLSELILLKVLHCRFLLISATFLSISSIQASYFWRHSAPVSALIFSSRSQYLASFTLSADVSCATLHASSLFSMVRAIFSSLSSDIFSKSLLILSSCSLWSVWPESCFWLGCFSSLQPEAGTRNADSVSLPVVFWFFSPSPRDWPSEIQKKSEDNHKIYL